MTADSSALKQALLYPWNDGDSETTLVAGGSLTLLSPLVVPGLFVLRFNLRVVESVLDADDEPPGPRGLARPVRRRRRGGDRAPRLRRHPRRDRDRDPGRPGRRGRVPVPRRPAYRPLWLLAVAVLAANAVVLPVLDSAGIGVIPSGFVWFYVCVAMSFLYAQGAGSAGLEVEERGVLEDESASRAGEEGSVDDGGGGES